LADGCSVPECPIRHPESSARISERRSEFNGGGCCRSDRIWGAGAVPAWKTLDGWGGNAHAIAPSHQHAILGPAQVRDAHGEPYPDSRQGDGERKGCNVCQHAMAKIVGFVAGPLIARQIIRLLLGVLLPSLHVQVSPPSRRVSRGARSKLEHTMLFFRRYGPLGFHCCQFRDNLILISTLATGVPENVYMARMR
jgi:hypothetical protein